MARQRQEEIESELRSTEEFRDWLTEMPPSGVVHYTSLEAGTAILSNREIWATNLRRYDDSTELLHAARTIQRTLEDEGSSLQGEKVHPFWEPDKSENGLRWSRGPYTGYALCFSESQTTATNGKDTGTGGTDSPLSLHPPSWV